MGLSALPNELLAEITKQLVPNLADTRLGPARYNGLSYPRNKSYSGDSHVGLRSLTQTSRRLHAIAVRYLYHSIHIITIETLVLLVNTIVDRPCLAEHVREIAFVNYFRDPNDMDGSPSRTSINPADLVSNSFCEFMRDRVYQEGDKGPFRALKYALQVTPGYSIEVGDWACALLLSLTPNLEALYVFVARSKCLPLLTACFNAGDRVHGEKLDFLPRLTRLHLTGSWDTRHFTGALPQGWMEGRTIKNLELVGLPDSSILPNNGFLRAAWESLETIRMAGREISVTSANAASAWFHRLCSEVRPPLKHIDLALPAFDHLDFFGSHYAPVVPASASVVGLNETLGLYAGTLQKLCLDIDSGSSSDCLSLLGPSKKLTCVLEMALLTDLTVSAVILFGSQMEMQHGNICDTLPPSIQRLHFEEFIKLTAQSSPPMRPRNVPAGSNTSSQANNGDKTRPLGYSKLVARAVGQLVVAESAVRLPCLARVSLTAPKDHWLVKGRKIRSVAPTIEVRDGRATASFVPRR